MSDATADATALVPQTLRARDGARYTLYTTQLPGLGAVAPVLIFWPAMGVESSYYSGLARAFSTRGIRFVCADLRGHGSSSMRPGRRTDFDFDTLVQADFGPALEALEVRYPGAPIFMGGHSLGGQLSVLFAAAHPGRVAGVVTVAACSVYWKTFGERPLRLLLGSQTLRLIAQAVGHLPGARLGFGGREARGVIRDWAHQARTGRYAPRGAITNYEAALKCSTTPALLISLEGDDWGPASAVDHLARKLPSAKATRVHVTDPALSATRKPHFHWVGAHDGVLDTIAEWLSTQRVNRHTQ